MSLRIWLPLTSIHSQQNGISDYNTSWSANSVSNDGKIGRCAVITNHTDTHIPISEWNYPENSVSYGAWFKFNKTDIQNKITNFTWDSNNRTAIGGLIGNINYGGFSLRLQTNDIYADGSFLSVRVYSYLRSSSTYANVSYVSTKTTVPFDTWVHVFTVLDRKEGRMKNYVDGILTSSIVVDVNKITAETMQDKIGNFIVAQSSMDGGVARVTSLPFKINDLRIYDEALSPKQIKELAKGLVAHYKFDDPYIEGTTNLVPANIYNHTGVPGPYYSGIREITTFDGFKCFSITTVANSSHSDGFICQQTGNCVEGEKYTYSGYAWIPTGYSWVFGERQINGGGAYASIALSGNSQWQYFSKTFIANDNTSGMIEGHEDGDYSTAHTIYIRDLQLEKKDHATPFAKGTRLSSSWVTDVSGYLHYLNTRSGYATSSKDTPRYILSTANNNDIFYYNNFHLEGDTTFSVWVKPTNITSTTQWICNLGTGTGVNCQHGIYINSTEVHGVGGTTPNAIKIMTISNNTWYYLVSVKRDDVVSIYVNGEKGTDGVADPALTKSLLTVCDRADGSTPGSSAGYRFQGQLSDLRLYCTALTEEDIKELYQTGAIIDNKNNMLAYEFIEE